MLDAWIYAEDRATSGDVSMLLAECGYSPRHVRSQESLVPSGEDGAQVRIPALAMVIASSGEPAPSELVARLKDVEELNDVPVVLALEPEHLATCPEVVTADELIVRPFSVEELRARVTRARRTVSAIDDEEILRAGALELNLRTYQVTLAGQIVSFAYMEYHLLRFLMLQPGRVFSREALLRRVWGYDYYGGARTVDVHIRRVRAKLGPEHARIKTVRSVGYMFDSGSTPHGLAERFLDSAA